uniref:Uncharacterized protein n=1 Tax=Haptolina ericina TaxID=156174 RepID=A0A7S3F0S2_9EUKA
MPERIIEADAFAQKDHCQLPLVGLKCSEKPWASCTGEMWRRCISIYNVTTCPIKMVNLHHTSRARAPPRHECWTLKDQVGYTEKMSFRSIG